jgi:hypothetical protein
MQQGWVAYSRCDAVWKSGSTQHLSEGGSQAFYDKWSFIPSNTGFDTMRAHEPLIPVNLLKHFKGVK